MKRPLGLLASFVMSLICLTIAHAEDAQITVTGSAEIIISPTEATLSIDIETSAPTAAVAGSENARISKMVRSALQAEKLQADDIVGSRLTVGPRWHYDETTKHQERVGFEATNSIQIKTAQFDKIAAYIDSALTAGATRISEILYAAKNQDAARRQALSQAALDARQDAEALARASNGKLGDLVFLSTEQANHVPGVAFEEITVTGSRQGSTIDTEIIEPTIKVTATVLARWRFQPQLSP